MDTLLPRETNAGMIGQAAPTKIDKHAGIYMSICQLDSAINHAREIKCRVLGSNEGPKEPTNKPCTPSLAEFLESAEEEIRQRTSLLNEILHEIEKIILG